MQNTIRDIADLQISAFDYELPEDRIARYPLEFRDLSKLLVYRNGSISDETFSNLPDVLSGNELLIVNNTKVIHSRLRFQKETGATIEIFCLEPCAPSEYVTALQSRASCIWKCLIGNQKRWKGGSLQLEVESAQGSILMEASRKGQDGTSVLVEFTWNGNITFAELLEITGKTPIPPYLNRDSETIDSERYQTVYSSVDGSVAAPTAGLHFTPGVFEQLRNKGIETDDVTLHVGAGTFKPVQTEEVSKHEMHPEFFTVSKETLEHLAQKASSLVAVGTTSLRTLESLYWLAAKVKSGQIPENDDLWLDQWEPYQLKADFTYTEAIGILLKHMEAANQNTLHAKTKIMIVPGYTIRSCSALITNFHQPKSTLLLLVSAFIGKNWQKVYAHALSNNYRFLSYGDSSILFR